jgi:hypothetical protein
MTLSAEDVRIAHQALNEILHGPDAIEDWEFHSRIGVDRAQAIAVLGKLEKIYDELNGATPQPPRGAIR